MTRIAHRGAILNFRDDPGDRDDPHSYQYWEQGALIVADGKVERIGPAAELLSDAGLTVIDHGARLLLPGFIDTHIHYPQTDVIAAGGRHLLEWLERYTFPAEQRFADPDHARAVAQFFCDELLRNGTTTAQVLGTVHSVSIDSFFEVAAARALRMIAGKALMDRLCPEGLRDASAADGERETRALIERWHGRDRLHYAITPRFALTSTEAQLESCGRLARDYPDVFIHSHLAENTQEVSEVCAAFPQRRSYLDVYDHYGLLRERATYAHCIHLDATDRKRLAQSGAGAAFCPSSNLYLGSGLFDIAAADGAGVPFALATDVGGGSSFSMLRTMADAYKVAQLSGRLLTPLRAFYLATLAGARQLRLQDRIGSFTAGHEADFIVLDPAATPLLARRMEQCRDLGERLRLWMILGDDRAIAHTYVLGQRVGGQAGS
jgi:guanine deaminase